MANYVNISATSGLPLCVKPGIMNSGKFKWTKPNTYNIKGQNKSNKFASLSNKLIYIAVICENVER